MYKFLEDLRPRLARFPRLPTFRLDFGLNRRPRLALLGPLRRPRLAIVLPVKPAVRTIRERLPPENEGDVRLISPAGRDSVPLPAMFILVLKQ